MSQFKRGISIKIHVYLVINPIFTCNLGV